MKRSKILVTNKYKIKSNSIAKEFEKLRAKLHYYTDTSTDLYENNKILDISRELDELHLKYINCKKNN